MPFAPCETRSSRPASRSPAEITMMPDHGDPGGGGEAKQVLGLMEALEDLDDVQAVYANFDISEALMSAL